MTGSVPSRAEPAMVKKVSSVTDLKDIGPGNIILWMHRRSLPRYFFNDNFFDVVESTSRIQDLSCGYDRTSFLLDSGYDVHYSSHEMLSFADNILKAYDILILDSIDDLMESLPVAVGIQKSDIIVEGANRYAIVLSRYH